MKTKFLSGCLAALWLALCTVSSCKDEDKVPVITTLSPVFLWDKLSVNLETDNGWALTRYQNRIAVTNVEVRKQYLLQWEGGLATGEKSNATLQWKEGNTYDIISLDQLNMEYIDGFFYRLTFSKDGEEGLLVFSIDTAL